jgi:2-polyprenyl-6-methoxyphenol hydroxylase-like FAD-dependent oxidoreductase
VGVLLGNCTMAEDTGLVAMDFTSGSMAILFPQGGGRARAYWALRGEGAKRLAGADGLGAFVEACSRTGAPADVYENVTVEGPLGTFDANDSWVDQPYRDGVVLVGDAAGVSDPTWGQGMSLAFRDVRTLRDALISTDDWDAAGRAYAEQHDHYFHATIDVESWMQAVFLDPGPEADARRARALPLIAADPMRIPDHGFSGPDLPCDDLVRQRFFGEAP